MKCPACGKPFTTLFVCPECWWKTPVEDRRQLYAMHSKKQPTESKVEKIVRNLKASK